MIVSLLVSLAVVAGNADTNSIRMQRMERAADSLRQQWQKKWKSSDSMRVESMFDRMRSDSLRAVISRMKADTIAGNKPVVDSLILKRLANTARSSSVKPGATISDSISAAVLVTVADTGMASYYADAFHGRKTSSGEVYNMNDNTCAHRWLPFGTMLKVVNIKNGKTTTVRVNDRGPWKHSRILDLSKAAAQELDMIRAGTATVVISVEGVPVPASAP